MLPEQQQRIMGYFIEEAKDHLNTIEQGLLSLQSTLEDAEKANEVFRAAHSVKGGAAMLGLESIQKVAHRMEDYFKILKDSSVQVDRTLETMFLRVSDGLKELLEQLEGPFGLTQDKAKAIMADVEPVFEQLEAHLDSLIELSVGEAVTSGTAATPDAPFNNALRTSFKRDVALLLRQLLTQFKQSDTAETRQTIQETCTQLKTIGEQFNLSAWCDLIETARIASANLDNDYRMLAPTLIKEIKGAQDLVLSGRASEISVSEVMQSLLPEDLLDAELDSLGDDDLDSEHSRLDAVLNGSEISDGFSNDLFFDEGSIDSTPEDIISKSGTEGNIFEMASVEAESASESDDSVLIDDDDLSGLFESELGDSDFFSSSLEQSESASEEAISLEKSTTEDTKEAGETEERSSLDLDFDEIPSELSAFNRNSDSEEKSDESLDALLATVNVNGPEVGADELNNLADLFDGDLDELDNTLGGHAFASEEMQLNPDRGVLSEADDLSDLLMQESAEESFAEAGTDGSEDDLFGGTLTNGEFAPDDDFDLSAFDDVASNDVTFDSVENSAVNESTTTPPNPETFQSAEEISDIVRVVSSDIAADMAALSEDVWAEDVRAEDLQEEGGLPEDRRSDALEDDATSLSGDRTIPEDNLPESNPPESELVHNQRVPSLSTKRVIRSMPSKKAASRESVGFPVLTGVELKEAEKDIDSFFLDTDTDETVEQPSQEEPISSLSSVEDSLLPDPLSSPKEHLADNLWTELSVDSLDESLSSSAVDEPDPAVSELSETAPDFYSEDSDLEVEDSDLDELSIEVTEDRTPTTAEEAEESVDDLLDELELLSADDDGSDLSTAVGEEGDSGEAIAPPDISPGSDHLLGEEISDEVLAEFETAFGFQTVETETDAHEEKSTDEISTTKTENESSGPTVDSEAEIGDAELPALFDQASSEDFSDEAEEPSERPDTETRTDISFESDLPESGLSEPGPPEQGFVMFEDESLADAFDDDFDDLDALLSEAGAEAEGSEEEIAEEDFNDEPSSEMSSTLVGTEEVSSGPAASTDSDEDFDDLERLLEDGDTTKSTAGRRPPQRVARRGGGIRDQNMRVSVNHLDNLSNLVGELVVSRNTLERDQERLRQFLDNLLFQVQQLNDVGQRMRDLYERSLLESSLLSNRRTYSTSSKNSSDAPDHATGETFDALEMDRFTGFHTLSQEMIELIVRVRESSSDIGYTVESSDQVTRQFRQITTQLQEGLNTARMVAFSQAADRLPRAVRDISLKCGKEAKLVVEGQDTLIDKMIVEHLYDPLTHLVNNAITHGIETPAVRQAAGKPSEGLITVRAFYQGNQTVIYVADDGGGINTELVKRKAIEKNLITQIEADSLSNLEVYDLLFHPGFSTRDQADDFAGRGVGMDVVRTSLAEIRGSVTVDSELGQGTSFTIRLPLTLSISKALSCVSSQARIAFPMDGVEDMLDVPRDRIVQDDDGRDCVRWRDNLLPLRPVTDLLKFNRPLGRGRVYGGNQDEDTLSVIVLRNANTFVAIQVDQVIGEEEIVIKQLEGPVPKPLGIAGATVLGDGRVMPIADILELIDIATGRVRREPASMMWTESAIEAAPAKNDPTVLIVDDSITVRELLSMSFKKVGYRVEQARDGQEAWDKLRSGLPCDLVFCDIEMPRMDGLELLSRMQKDSHLSHVPIAMLTSRGADRHRQMAVDLGASGYFTKPYLEEALLDAAQRMLNGETLAKGRGG